MALTKGVGFQHVRSFVTDAHGASGWDQTLSLFERPDREALESVLAMGWYDLGLYARLLRAIDQRFGDGDLRLVSAIGRYEAEKDLTSIHQWLLRLVRPSIAIEQMSKYWRRFHDTGEWSAERRGDREICARLSGWGVVDAALCRELVAYLQRTLELLGAREVIMEHTRCRSRGEPECEFRARYRLRKDREESGASSRHGIDGGLASELLMGRPTSTPPLGDSSPDSRPPPALRSTRSTLPPARRSTLPPPVTLPPVTLPSSVGLEGPRTERPPSTSRSPLGRPRR